MWFRHRALVGVLVPLLIAGCASQPVKQSWVADYKYVDSDPFPGMNVQGRNVTLTQADINGRVIWNLWSGDNAGFWNWLAKYGFGTGDLLKMIASPRNRRFQTYGVFNQPGFVQPAQKKRTDSAASMDPVRPRVMGKLLSVCLLRLL